MKKVFAISIIGMLVSATVNASGFVSQKVIDQFASIDVNGLTAQQVADDAKNSTFTDARRQIEVQKQNALHQQLKDEFDAADYRERSYRNIRSRDTIDYDSDPYDFVGGYGSYVHTLSFSDCNLTCWHSSVQGVNNHADALIARRKAYRALDSYNDDVKYNRVNARINNKMWELYGAEYDQKISNGLAPFRQKIIDTYKPDYDLINSASNGIKCMAVTQVEKKSTGAFAMIPSISYKHRVRCQDAHSYHSFDVYVDKEGIVRHGCECGHEISEHEPNFGAGNIEAKKVFLKQYDATKSYNAKESSYIKKLKTEISKVK